MNTTLDVRMQPESGETGILWHLWAVGLLALVWHSYSMARYLVLEFGPTGVAAAASSELARIAAFPQWVNAFWTVSVLAGLAGSVFLLIRSKWALQAFVMALVGHMGVTLYRFGMAPVPANYLDMPIAYSAFIVTLAVMLYTTRIHDSGVLR